MAWIAFFPGCGGLGGQRAYWHITPCCLGLVLPVVELVNGLCYHVIVKTHAMHLSLTHSVCICSLQRWRGEKKDLVYLQQWVPKCRRNPCHSSPNLLAAAHFPQSRFSHEQISFSNAATGSVGHVPEKRYLLVSRAGEWNALLCVQRYLSDYSREITAFYIWLWTVVNASVIIRPSETFSKCLLNELKEWVSFENWKLWEC